MLLLSLLLLTILFMRFGPDVPFNRALNEQLVQKLILWVSKQKRHDYLFLILVSILMLTGGEILLMFGPEFIMVYAADLALYLDIVAASYLTTAVTNIKASIQAVRARFTSWRSRAFRLSRTAPRGRAARRPRDTNCAENDDDDSSELFRMAA